MMMSTILEMETFPLFSDWLEESARLTFGEDAGRDSAPVKGVTEVHRLLDNHKGLPSEDAQDVLADLFSMDYVDPLGEEWMDTVDLSHFLDENVGESTSNAISVVQQPKAKVESIKSTTPTLAILHSLLTQEVSTLSTPSSPEAQVCPDVMGATTDHHLWPVTQESFLEIGSNPVQTDFTYQEQNDTSIAELSNYLSLDLPLSPDDLDVDSILSVSRSSSPITEVDSFCSSGVSSPAASCDNSLDYDGSGDTSVDCDPDYAPKTSKRSRSRKATTSLSFVKPEPVSPYLDRKERKKQQNKNAAIRYRMKKKAEATNVKGDESGLLKRNTDLKDKVDELSREIKYMKDLMAEVYKAKGLTLAKQQ